MSGTRAASTGPKEGQGEGKGVGSVTAPVAQLRVVEPAVVPDPEVRERAARRRFTAEYKLRVLRDADTCAGAGEIGALLRREGLYSSHLTTWRRQRELEPGGVGPEEAGLAGGGPLAAGQAGRRPRAGEGPPRAPAQTGRDHHRGPKKVSEILGIPLKSPDGDERT